VLVYLGIFIGILEEKTITSNSETNIFHLKIEERGGRKRMDLIGLFP